MKIRINDTVQIMTGKDKGKTGKVLRVLPAKNMVMVEGINQFKRHMKGQAQGQKSEIITITKPLNASKVSLIDPKKKKPTRVGFKIEKGKKVRISRKSQSEI